MDHVNCASMSGPVFAAAMRALEENDVRVALAYVPRAAEAEVVAAFEITAPLRASESAIRAVGNLHFAEAVVRLHRAGDDMAYTGIQAGRQDTGGVAEAAEEAVISGSAYELFEILSAQLTLELNKRLGEVRELAKLAPESTEAMRSYVEATMAFTGWAAQLGESIRRTG